MSLNEKIFKIRKSFKKDITIKFGNIFSEEGFKVIPFNEYFDTLVDEEVVSSSTLHGIFLNNYVDDINELEGKLLKDLKLLGVPAGINFNRNKGKKQRYGLGTCIRFYDYLLVAFSRFDKNHKAYLSFKDYKECMRVMWDNILHLYSNPEAHIILPVMGSGVTQISNKYLDQENLNNTYSILINEMLRPIKEEFFQSVKMLKAIRITILIHDKLKDKINLDELKIY